MLTAHQKLVRWTIVGNNILSELYAGMIKPGTVATIPFEMVWNANKVTSRIGDDYGRVLHSYITKHFEASTTDNT